MQQQINHNKNTNNMAQQKQNLATKTIAKLICTMLLLPALLLPSLAQADFRKALNAYQNRDGKTMLAEVQDAVDKKNDDGILLFIDSLILENKEIKYFDNIFSPAGKLKLLVVLDDKKTQLLFSQLAKFTSQTEYAFRLAHKKYRDDTKLRMAAFKAVAKQGNANAALAYYFELSLLNDKNTLDEQAFWLKKSAHLGNPYAANLVAHQHLNGAFGMRNEKVFPFNKKVAFKWLKKSLDKSDPLTRAYTNMLGSLHTYYGLTANDLVRQKQSTDIIDDKPLLTIKKMSSGELSSFYYQIDIYENGRVMLLRDAVVNEDEMSTQPAFILPQYELAMLIKDLEQIHYKNWDAHYRHKTYFNRGDFYIVRIVFKNQEKVTTFSVPDNNLELSLPIHQVLLAVEKVIPIHLYSYAAVPSIINVLPNREINLANNTKKELTK